MARLFLVHAGMSLLAVLLVPGLILYFMTPEERQRLLRWIEGCLVRARVVVSTSRSREGDPFFTALRARRRWPVVTWTLVAANVAVLIAMLAGPDPLGATDTLMAWGGNFGPRTTSAERWRVLSSVFVHRGALHLLVNMIVLVQLGLILERMVGPFTFGTIYIASGVLGSVMSTVAAPMGVFVGAAGAVCGLYGLLGIAAFRGMVQSTAVRIPLRILTTLVPTAVIFCAYYLVSGDSWLTAKFGLCTGFVSGVVLTRSVADERVRLRRYAALGFATAGIVVLSAPAAQRETSVAGKCTRLKPLGQVIAEMVASGAAGDPRDEDAENREGVVVAPSLARLEGERQFGQPGEPLVAPQCDGVGTRLCTVLGHRPLQRRVDRDHPVPAGVGQQVTHCDRPRHRHRSSSRWRGR